MITILEKGVIVTVKINVKSLENKYMFKIFSYLKILFKNYFGLWEKKTLNKVSIDLSNWSFLSVLFFCVVCCIQKCYPKSVLKNIISYLMEVIYKIIHDFLNNRNFSLYLKISLIFFYVNVFSESPRKRHTDLSSTEHIFMEHVLDQCSLVFTWEIPLWRLSQKSAIWKQKYF